MNIIKKSVCILASWLSSFSYLGALEHDSRVLSDDQVKLAREILSISNSSFKSKTSARLDYKDFLESPYWVKVYSLGNSVSDEQFFDLSENEEKPIEELIAFNSKICAKDAEVIKGLVKAYKSEYQQRKNKNGLQYIKLNQDHVTPAFRPVWEMLLLSPRIEKLKVRRLREALQVCGDRGTMLILRAAKLKLIMSGDFTNQAPESYAACRSMVAATIGNWVRLVEKIDPGGVQGLRELLRAQVFVGDQFPMLGKLERFETSPFYNVKFKGVQRYMTEDVFLKKDDEGLYLWKNAFMTIDPKLVSEDELKIIVSMKHRLVKGS